MTPNSENEIVESLAELVHGGRDETWAEAAIEMAFADGFSQMRTWFRTRLDGAWEPTARYAGWSEDFAGRFAELRRLMYRPDRGTWFSARLTVSHQGDYRSDYDYDTRPAFDPPASPELFVRDLEAFPRDASRVPSWLADELP